MRLFNIIAPVSKSEPKRPQPRVTYVKVRHLGKKKTFELVEKTDNSYIVKCNDGHRHVLAKVDTEILRTKTKRRELRKYRTDRT